MIAVLIIPQKDFREIFERCEFACRGRGPTKRRGNGNVLLRALKPRINSFLFLVAAVA